jgi:hypothetical protein
MALYSEPEGTHNSKTAFFYFKVLFFATYLGSIYPTIKFIPKQIFGFALSGYSWIIVLLISLYYIFFRVERSFFPWKLWLPWYFFLIAYLLIDFSSLGLQSTLQLLVPFLVGIVTASFDYTEPVFNKFLSHTKYLLIIVFLFSTIISIILYGLWGVGPATFAHISSIGAVFAISNYYQNKLSINLFYYIIALIIPVVSVTRMGVLVVLLIPILHFYKLFTFKKLIFTALIIIVGTYIFYMPEVQDKMFYSGKGNLSDLSYNNKDLNTSGRKNVNKHVQEKVKEKPLLGFGPRADYQLLHSIDSPLKELHNDYLQITYNYGKIGLFLFISILILQFFLIWGVKPQSEEVNFIKSTILTMYIPLLLFMATDTIIKTSFSFMNFFFAIIGILYSLVNSSTEIRPKYEDFSSNSSI